MRIGMFADMYTPHVSGVTNYIRLYKREFERLGHEVHVLTYGSRGHADDELRVTRSPGLPFFGTGWQLPGPVSAEARAVMRSLDVAHVHHPFVSGPVALRHCPQAASVFTNHTRYDVYAKHYAGWLPGSIAEDFARGRLGRFYRSLDAVLAPSPEIASWLSEWTGFDDAIVFRNVIDVEQFSQPVAPMSRAELGFSDADVVVAYLGRMAEEKNMALLVDAFVRASARVPELAMVLIGDGPSRAASERRLAEAGLAERVRFLGMVDYEDCPDVLAAADLFATASTSETYPLVVMEAAAAGLPTLGVRSAGVGEVVRDGETGLLTAEDASVYTDALVRLATDSELRTRLAEGARTAAREHDIRPAAERMIALYESLIARRAGEVAASDTLGAAHGAEPRTDGRDMSATPREPA